MAIGSLLYMLAVGGIFWFLIRMLKLQLGGDPLDAIRVVKAMGQGNMRVETEARKGDQDSLIGQLRTMQSSLKGMVNRIRFDALKVTDNAASFAHSTHEISATAGELARNAETQQASVERTVNPPNGKKQAIKRIVPLGSLPAIPYEIVAQHK